MTKEWKDMSPKEKREARFAEWISPEGVKFKSVQAERDYRERVQRFIDAVSLEKLPDRIPILISGTFLQTNLYGVDSRTALYDYEKLGEAHKKYLIDFQPDYCSSPAMAGAGIVYDTLDYRQYLWPGHGVSEKSGYQALEKEYMKAEDYPALIDDPSDFWLRTWMPRAFGALEGLKDLPSFPNIWEIVGISGSMIPFGLPHVQKALKALMDAGNEALKWIGKIGAYSTEFKSMGFPGLTGGVCKAPYDVLADTLRGTRGMMLDLYRQPDMVLKAVERIIPLQIKQGVGMATQAKNPNVFIPMHKGADGFMSDEQFKKFYWPSFKAVIHGLAEEGCVPYLFCEGSFNSRLQYLKELTKASCYWVFDRTDMTEVKKVIGKDICIGGNVPSGLLLTGTPQDVKDYCKKLIDTAGKGGGFIMATGTAMDEGNPDTLHAMIDFTKEYGVYK
ncbi:MAG: uroporphyrinogen decarboxylase [Spirochaetes bacterium]|nr:uroporphyrinogen decarboxylase [Spirochaetota bacterium]